MSELFRVFMDLMGKVVPKETWWELLMFYWFLIFTSQSLKSDWSTSYTYLQRPPKQSVCHLVCLWPVAGQWPFTPVSEGSLVICQWEMMDWDEGLTFYRCQTFSRNRKVCWRNRPWWRAQKGMKRKSFSLRGSQWDGDTPLVKTAG